MSTSSTISTWAAGDYPAMARHLVPAAERAVAAAAPGPGTTVVDIGCGTGNAALRAARDGADVTATDPTPQLLAIARERAREAGLPMAFREASVEDVTGTYDRVVSVFGAMYAPDHARAAEALVRCCSPRGLIVSAAWTPGGLMAATNRAMGPYLQHAPASGPPPVRWGDEAYVRGLFARCDVDVRQESVGFEFASFVEAAEFWARTAGHVQAERARLEAEGAWPALHLDLAAVFAERNEVAGANEGVRVESAYLLAVIRPWTHL